MKTKIFEDFQICISVPFTFQKPGNSTFLKLYDLVARPYIHKGNYWKVNP